MRSPTSHQGNKALPARIFLRTDKKIGRIRTRNIDLAELAGTGGKTTNVNY